MDQSLPTKRTHEKDQSGGRGRRRGPRKKQRQNGDGGCGGNDNAAPMDVERTTSNNNNNNHNNSGERNVNSRGNQRDGRGGGRGRGRGRGRGGGRGGRGGGGRGRGEGSNKGNDPSQLKEVASAPGIEPSNMDDAIGAEEMVVEKTDSFPSTAKLHITTQRFADLPISDESRRAMKSVFKYEFMTQVQDATLPYILKGGDCLAKAKTGTGKTLGFLIPTIEHLAQNNGRKGKKDASEIGCLCISPTRELAFQISAEAEKLLTFHKDIRVVTVVGGTPIGKDVKALKGSVDVLVATPGRLLDHMQNSGVAERMANLKVLIMDEADQLLDMGFRPDIERILRHLSSSLGIRQTLLFSATVPDSVSEIARIALRPEYEFVNTVSEEEEQTHLHVRQELVVAPQADQISALASILFQEMSAGHYKVIVFFTTARLTGFMAELFNSVQAFGKILEIHSRKSQGVRQKASDQFRKSKNAILFSSDVSARGMDYPDVTAVIQVGLTERAQYIHRLGRTARAGKNGHGILLLAPYEENHMVGKELSDLPLQKISCPPLSQDQNAVVDKALGGVTKDKSLNESAEQAYRAWLGYYNGNLKKCGWNKATLVSEANVWAKDIGLSKQPSLLKKTVGKMGLKGVPGLKIE